MGPWSREREVARGVLRSLPNLKKKVYLPIGEGSRFVAVCLQHTSGQMFLHQTTPGRRPPLVNGVVNSVTRGRIGAPNECVPFRFHDAVTDFRSMSACRGLGISPLRIKHFAGVFSSTSWPNIRPGTIFFSFFSFFFVWIFFQIQLL